MRAPAWMRQEDSGTAGSTESVDEDCPAKGRKILGSDAALGQVPACPQHPLQTATRMLPGVWSTGLWFLEAPW
jgi:hypothetical protein